MPAATQGNTVAMRMVIDFCVDHLLLFFSFMTLAAAPLDDKTGAIEIVILNALRVVFLAWEWAGDYYYPR